MEGELLVKCLEVNLDSHVKKICKTNKVNVICLKMIRNCLTFDCAFLFLNSMIFSHMSSGLSAGSQSNQSN